MLFTLLPAVMLMAGLLLMLWAEVGFIQDKKFASSAPQEELDLIPETKPERFRGQHAVGWAMVVLSFALILGAVLLGAWDGIRNGFGFGQFYARFLVMLLALKAFDIGFFDWFLLCNKGLHFFTHYYPEAEPALGTHLFGYNKKTHVFQIFLCFVVAAALAGICMLF